MRSLVPGLSLASNGQNKDRIELGHVPIKSHAAAPPGAPRFRLGDKVPFDDAKGHALVGLIKRINRRTATLETMDHRTWRVGSELLRHVVEV